MLGCGLTRKRIVERTVVVPVVSEIDLNYAISLSEMVFSSLGYTTKEVDKENGYIYGIRKVENDPYSRVNGLKLWVDLISSKSVSFSVEPIICWGCIPKDEGFESSSWVVDKFREKLLAVFNEKNIILDKVSVVQRVSPYNTFSTKVAPNKPEEKNKQIPSKYSLGVVIQELTNELKSFLNIGPDQQGVVIKKVTPQSSAEKAGLKRGDIIIKVGDVPVTKTEEVIYSINSSKGEIAFTVSRDQQILELNVVLDSADEQKDDLKEQNEASKKEPAKAEDVKKFEFDMYFIKLKPEKIAAGAEFAVAVEYMLSDPDIKEQTQLPVKISYSIKEDDVVLLQSSSSVMVVNNKRMLTAKNDLVADSRKGTYLLTVELSYKDKKITKTKEFVVQ